jgi:hypothetical protein
MLEIACARGSEDYDVQSAQGIAKAAVLALVAAGRLLPACSVWHCILLVAHMLCCYSLHGTDTYSMVSRDVSRNRRLDRSTKGKSCGGFQEAGAKGAIAEARRLGTSGPAEIVSLHACPTPQHPPPGPCRSAGTCSWLLTWGSSECGLDPHELPAVPQQELQGGGEAPRASTWLMPVY